MPVASRTERDLSMRVVVGGSVVIMAMIWAFLKFKPIPGAQTGAFANLIAALFIIVFGFLFVTVASRISGLIGNSSNPISGMTIATLMATCAVFLVVHWTANAYAVLALTIGGVVCIAAAIAGATSQDLKTGYLVGATPAKQQIALVIGVMVSSLAIGGTLILMNVGLAQYKPIQIRARHQSSADGRRTPAEQLRARGQDVRAGERHRLERNSRRKISLRSRDAARSKFSGSRESAARRRRRRKRG